VIPNGVDLVALRAGAAQRATFRQRFGLDDSTRMILTMARLVPDKGQQHLLDALARPEMQPYRAAVRLVLVGDGPTREGLQAQARALGLGDSVVFAGRLPHDEVPGLLSAADIVVVPSSAEGMSISLLEAMACARPIIASDIPAIASVVADGVTGRLFPVAQPAGLAKALAEFLAEPRRAARMGERAQTIVTERYDQRVMVADYERVFARTAAGASEVGRPTNPVGS
jgi:glycosyltransferase involved in cell wall biosynthesis